VVAMISKIVDLLFGCWHRNYSFPLTSKPGHRRSEAALVTGTYVVCLDCGRELPYDWREMRVVSANRSARSRLAEAAEQARAA
jgi:hypothetical protein